MVIAVDVNNKHTHTRTHANTHTRTHNIIIPVCLYVYLHISSLFQKNVHLGARGQNSSARVNTGSHYCPHASWSVCFIGQLGKRGRSNTTEAQAAGRKSKITSCPKRNRAWANRLHSSQSDFVIRPEETISSALISSSCKSSCRANKRRKKRTTKKASTTNQDSKKEKNGWGGGKRGDGSRGSINRHRNPHRRTRYIHAHDIIYNYETPGS